MYMLLAQIRKLLTFFLRVSAEQIFHLSSKVVHHVAFW